MLLSQAATLGKRHASDLLMPSEGEIVSYYPEAGISRCVILLEGMFFRLCGSTMYSRGNFLEFDMDAASLCRAKLHALARSIISHSALEMPVKSLHQTPHHHDIQKPYRS